MNNSCDAVISEGARRGGGASSQCAKGCTQEQGDVAWGAHVYDVHDVKMTPSRISCIFLSLCLQGFERREGKDNTWGSLNGRDGQTDRRPEEALYDLYEFGVVTKNFKPGAKINVELVGRILW